MARHVRERRRAPREGGPGERGQPRSALRRGNHRVHALRRRLRDHARMRAARGSEIAAGRARRHAEDRFSRTWSSFDRLARGDVIGQRHDGTTLTADGDGWILFPDVGAKPGHEWYYVAEPVEI